MIYWLTGQPGAGKTVLASEIINSFYKKKKDSCFMSQTSSFRATRKRLIK